MGWLVDKIEDPLSSFWICLILAWIAQRAKKLTLFRATTIFAGVWLFVVFISPVPLVVTHNLEYRYPVFDSLKFTSRGEVHILVLGGGHMQAPHLPPGIQLERSALNRLTEAVRIKNMIPGSKLICSGGSSSNRTTQAELLAATASGLGVPLTDIITIQTPQSTQEEARAYYTRFGNEFTLVLVTSAMHMPRAAKTFQIHGMEPVPAPANHFVKSEFDELVYNFEPSLRKIQMMKKAIHEYLGLLALEF